MPYYYLSLFFIIAFFALIEQLKLNVTSVRITRFIPFFIVFITSAFRYETGVDWHTYDNVFSIISPISDLFVYGSSYFFSQIGFEYGFRLLSAIVKEFGGNMQVIYFIIAFINIILLYKSLTYFSKYPILCLLGYYSFTFFILDLSGIRQSLALNIILYGLRYTYERKLLKYFIAILIASSFHNSAIFCIIIYPLFYKKKSYFNLLYIIYTFSLIIVLVQIKWLQTITAYVLPIFGFNDEISRKMIFYAFSSNFEDTHLNIFKIAFGLFLTLFILKYKKIILKSNLSNFIFLCFMLFLILNNLMFEISEINSRISAYLIIFLVIEVSDIIQHLKINFNKIVFYSIITIYCFMYSSVYLLEKPATISYYPYQNYIIYKLFGFKSTGEERLSKFQNR